MGGTLLDELLRDFDFAHSHAIVVPAPRARVARALGRTRVDSDTSFLVRLLSWLRGVSLPPGSLRDSLVTAGFTVLGETPGEEIIVGIAGRFWALHERANLVHVADAAAFSAFARPGFAKAAMNIRLDALTSSATRVSTETRVQCTDAGAYWRFALYWTLIKPFSLWIRYEMLRAIARRAIAEEGASGDSDPPASVPPRTRGR